MLRAASPGHEAMQVLCGVWLVQSAFVHVSQSPRSQSALALQVTVVSPVQQLPTPLSHVAVQLPRLQVWPPLFGPQA